MNVYKREYLATFLSQIAFALLYYRYFIRQCLLADPKGDSEFLITEKVLSPQLEVNLDTQIYV